MYIINVEINYRSIANKIHHHRVILWCIFPTNKDILHNLIKKDRFSLRFYVPPSNVDLYL